jgi:hypothetical protein
VICVDEVIVMNNEKDIRMIDFWCCFGSKWNKWDI